MSFRALYRRGLTLAEVLATIAVIAIVIPIAMKGVSVATSLASATRLRTEATCLAQGKLDELIATGEWETAGLSGDFGAQWPMFRWEAAVNDWDEVDVRLVEVRVTWLSRGQERDVTLSTLLYTPSEVTTQ